MEIQHILAFTDGSSRGNPGPGGWASVLSFGGKVVELGGKEDDTTNNRMELTALIETLEYIEHRKIEGDIVLHVDSQYVISGATIWMYAWEKNNWMTQGNERVLNQDLWQRLLPLLFRMKQKRTVTFQKVEGHAGVLGNERTDRLATSFADGERVVLFVGGLHDYESLIGGKLANITPTALVKKSSSKTKKAYSYVSFVDGHIYTDSDWATCEKRVKGKHGAKFKKAFSKEEEAELIKKFTE